MKELLKKHKTTILILLIFIVLITYCGLQTFVINDDLPYSLFHRSNVRVTNIMQIIRNQASDYLNINGRFFIHCIVQFVLMFGKNLFAPLNALCIVTTIIFMKKIIDLKLKNKKIKSVYLYLLLIGMFLLLGNYKYLIYWVAGSVNYIWLFTLIIIFIYYYLKVGLDKYKKLNCLIFFAFSIVHECSFVFVLFLLLADIIKNLIDKKKSLKEYLIYLIYLICAIIGGLIVTMAPGNALRMSSASYWYDLSFIDRLKTSIPVVSKDLFNLFDINNLIPTLFLITFAIYNFKDTNKLNKVMSVLIVICSIIAFITGNGWIYFILSILVFIAVLFLYYLKKDNSMSVIMIALYAVTFSMIITPEYHGARPNYYIYIWMITCTLIYLNSIFNNKLAIKIIEIFSIAFAIIMCFFEFDIYYNIGKIHKERLKQIEYVKENDLKVLEYKKIDDKYAKYHPDANCPSDSSYWAYKYFRYYYGLEEDVKIKLVD